MLARGITHSDYDAANDVTLHTYSFLNKMGPGEKYPDLSHAVIQYAGKCCVSQVRVYTIEKGSEVTYFITKNPVDHIQNPKPTVCMSGVDLPGVEGAGTYYFELAVNGYFPKKAMVDYVLRGGELIKYGQVQGPSCACDVRRNLRERRTFRGVPLWLRTQKRRLSCVDKAMSISEVTFLGKCNEA